jgi:hypothetical protein
MIKGDKMSAKMLVVNCGINVVIDFPIKSISTIHPTCAANAVFDYKIIHHISHEISDHMSHEIIALRTESRTQ